MNKKQEYTVKIIEQIAAMFDEESDNYINKDDFDSDDNATDFFYALTMASAHIYTTFSGDKVDVLGFNHIANRLILQNNK